MTNGNKSMRFSRSLLVKGFSILSFAIVFSACGGDESQGSVSIEDSINNKTITGVSQKGPFINGSSVSVQELDGKTLAQTGKVFKGKISNDRGEFTVSNVTLASRYALLEANGFYRNEVTGEKSVAPIILNAIVDLSDRDQVNINLLTHLEYERIIFLVNTGMDVLAAKKQAESEVLRSFGITGDFENSEDLNILATGDGNAALLAISILLQGNLSEAELSERLANYARDIEDDGEWNDDSTKVEIAKWASRQHFDQVRSNIESWNLGPVPEFEKFVKMFEKNVNTFLSEKIELGECFTPGETKQGADGKLYLCRGDGLWVGKCGKDVLWCGIDLDYRAKTSFGEESDNHGFWQELYGAEFIYPVPKDTSSSNAELAPIIEACEGLCGTGSLSDDHLSGFKFYLSNDVLMENDVSSWNGICIIYKSDLDGYIEIGTNSTSFGELKDVFPMADLPKTTDIKKMDFLWSDFKQPPYETIGRSFAIVTGMQIAEKMSFIQIRWRGETRMNFEFKIVGIGKYGTCQDPYLLF